MVADCCVEVVFGNLRASRALQSGFETCSRGIGGVVRKELGKETEGRTLHIGRLSNVALLNSMCTKKLSKPLPILLTD